MRRTLYLFILFCTFHLANGQITKKVYYRRGHNYSTVYSYFVTELILSSDSTFVTNYYKVPIKKKWKNYKNSEPLKKEGQISKKNKFYTLTELIDGKKTDRIDYVKITNQKVTFYLVDKEGKFEKVYTMKQKL